MKTTIRNILIMLLFSRITDCLKIDDVYNSGESDTTKPTRNVPPEVKPTRFPGKRLVNATTEADTTTVTVITWQILRESQRNVTVDVSTTRTTTEYIPGKEATPRSWEPEDGNVNPKPVKRNSTFPRLHKKNSTKIKEVCGMFKEGAINFELSKMADVWQTAYYKLPEKVQCFKIHIKKLTDKEKKDNAIKYGNFSGIVNWDKCHMEIKAATEINRKHFLQGDSENEGVLDNIIIVEEAYTGTQKLQEESADQWLVAHNMLLMRDCETGGVVVFSKVPHMSKQSEIEDALKDFSEEYMYGKMACDDEELSNRSFDNDDDVEL